MVDLREQYRTTAKRLGLEADERDAIPARAVFVPGIPEASRRVFLDYLSNSGFSAAEGPSYWLAFVQGLTAAEGTPRRGLGLVVDVAFSDVHAALVHPGSPPRVEASTTVDGLGADPRVGILTELLVKRASESLQQPIYWNDLDSRRREIDFVRPQAQRLADQLETGRVRARVSLSTQLTVQVLVDAKEVKEQLKLANQDLRRDLGRFLDGHAVAWIEILSPVIWNDEDLRRQLQQKVDDRSLQGPRANLLDLLVQGIAGGTRRATPVAPARTVDPVAVQTSGAGEAPPTLAPTSAAASPSAPQPPVASTGASPAAAAARPTPPPPPRRTTATLSSLDLPKSWWWAHLRDLSDTTIRKGDIHKPGTPAHRHKQLWDEITAWLDQMAVLAFPSGGVRWINQPNQFQAGRLSTTYWGRFAPENDGAASLLGDGFHIGFQLSRQLKWVDEVSPGLISQTNGPVLALWASTNDQRLAKVTHESAIRSVYDEVQREWLLARASEWTRPPMDASAELLVRVRQTQGNIEKPFESSSLLMPARTLLELRQREGLSVNFDLFSPLVTAAMAEADPAAVKTLVVKWMALLSEPVLRAREQAVEASRRLQTADALARFTPASVPPVRETQVVQSPTPVPPPVVTPEPVEPATPEETGAKKPTITVTASRGPSFFGWIGRILAAALMFGGSTIFFKKQSTFPPVEPPSPILRGTDPCTMVDCSPHFEGQLKSGQEQMIDLTLDEDWQYSIAGVCAINGCTDIDMYLFDDNGNELAKDVALDARPNIYFPDSRRINAKLKIRMVACDGRCAFRVHFFGSSEPKVTTNKPVDTPRSDTIADTVNRVDFDTSGNEAARDALGRALQISGGSQGYEFIDTLDILIARTDIAPELTARLVKSAFDLRKECSTYRENIDPSIRCP